MSRLPDLGEALARLRSICGLSLKTCAAGMKVDEKRLQAAERGDIDEAILRAAADYFGLDVDELRAGHVDSLGGNIFLLHQTLPNFSASDLPNLDRAMRQARALVAYSGVSSDSRIARRLRFNPIAPNGPYATMAARQGYELARRTRTALGLVTAPVGDIRRLLEEELGIAVVVDTLFSEGLRAAAIIDDDRSAAAAVLAHDEPHRTRTPELARVYLAHELCHLLFDPRSRRCLRIALDDFPDRGSANRGALTEDQLLECRAKGFAAEFLIPFVGVTRLLGTAPLSEPDLATAAAMSDTVRRHFGTPVQLTVHHLCNLGFIHKNLQGELPRNLDRQRVPGPITDLPNVGRGSILVASLSATDPEPADDPYAALQPLVEPSHKVANALRGAIRRSWDIVMDVGRAIEARSSALAELIGQSDPNVPEFLAQELDSDDLSPDWRDALILAALDVQFVDDDLRQRLLSALRTHAHSLRDAEAQEPLWTAIRLYASMIPVENATDLLAFLRPGDAPRTMQAALQGIFSIFEDQRSLRAPIVPRLRQRVHDLARERLAPDRVHTSADAALAFCCFQAAAALGDPELDVLFELLSRLGRERLTERGLELRAALVVRLAEQG